MNDDNLHLWQHSHAFGQDVRRPGETRTLIVVGVARSGTSMVAGVLEKLGVFMGTRRDQIVFEDTELAAMLEAQPPIENARDWLRARDSVHQVWGWKRPDAFKYLSSYLPAFRNPCLIVTFRDLLAISMRNAIAVESDPWQGLEP